MALSLINDPGLNTYVQIFDRTGTYSPPQSFAVRISQYSTGSSTSQQAISMTDWDSDGGARYEQLGVNSYNRGLPFRAEAVNLPSHGASGANISKYSWFYNTLAVFASSTRRTMYFDGVSAGTNTSSVTTANLDTLTIGAQRFGGTASWGMSGQLEEMAWWSAELTADDAISYAKRFCPLLIKPTSLQAYWPLGNVFGNNVKDRGPNKLDGTISGTTYAYDNSYPNNTIYPCECMCA